MLKHVVLLFGVIAVAYAALTKGRLEPKPDKFKNVPGCYIKTLDAVIPFGESRPAPVPGCEEYRCSTEDVTYVSCGTIDAHGPSNCKLISDNTVTYPDCCPKIRCL